VVRRITPIGEVYFGDVFFGVIQPFTHVLVVWPRRGGGDAGGGGGSTSVGDGETAVSRAVGDKGEAEPARFEPG